MTETPSTDPMDPALGWREHTILNPGMVGEAKLGGDALAPDDPNEPDIVYHAMTRRWEVIRANLEGIRYLRQFCDYYLPRFPRERRRQYIGRVSRAVYTPYLARLIRGAAGLILRKPIQLQGGDEAYWEEWRKDVDRQGSSLDDFARMTLGLSIAYGHSSILADYTSAERRNLLEQRLAGDKPFLVQVPCWATIGRRHNPRLGAGLQQVRIREIVEVAAGAYGTNLEEQIRVIEPGAYKVLRLTGTDWTEVPDEGGAISLSEIPLATTYSQKEGVLISRPPLEDCAHLNLAHFQRRSDLTQVLTIAGQPILDLIGWEGEEDEALDGDDTNPVDGEVGLSVNSALQYPIGGGSRYTEISGASCTAHQEELDRLKEQITQLGISVLTQQQTFQETEGAKSLDRAESNSMLSVIARDLAMTLQQVLNWCGEYVGREPPTVVIDNDFDHSKLTPEEAALVLKAYVDGGIDLPTFLEVWQTGEWLPDGLNIEQLADKLEGEEPEPEPTGGEVPADGEDPEQDEMAPGVEEPDPEAE
jgi:hypothetical protein